MSRDEMLERAAMAAYAASWTNVASTPEYLWAQLTTRETRQRWRAIAHATIEVFEQFFDGKTEV